MLKKKIDIESRNLSIDFELFDSTRECCETIMKRKLNRDFYSDRKYNTLSVGGVTESYNSKSWSGFTNRDDLVNQCMYGYQDNAQVRSLYSQIQRVVQSGTDAPMDIPITTAIGGCLDYNAFSNGAIDCMDDEEEDECSDRIIRVVMDVGQTCDVGAREMEKLAVSVVSRLVALERKGYQTEIICSNSFNPRSGYGRAYFMGVRVKRAGESLNLKRIMFPLASPAFFRGVAFSWYSSLPGARNMSGFGTSARNAYSNPYQVYTDVYGKKYTVILMSKLAYKSKSEIEEEMLEVIKPH